MFSVYFHSMQLFCLIWKKTSSDFVKNLSLYIWWIIWIS